MPKLPAVLVTVVLLSLACGGDVTPKYPREKIAFSLHEPPEQFGTMDLPWFGGIIEFASESSMTVSYSKKEASAEQLKEWWPEALEAEGWDRESENLSGNGTLDLTYKTPEGAKALVTIRPEGTLWWVIVSL